MAKKILLCGYGEIGKRMYPEYCKMGNVTIYDIKKLDNPPSNYITDTEKLKKYRFDLAILSLPTPTKYGECDTTIVIQVLDFLIDFNIAETIMLRSTVWVGFTESFIKSRNVHNIVFAPEFYGTTQHQANNDFLILGGDRENSNKIAQLYYKIKKGDFKIKFYKDPTTAEMIKYMANCYLATKVVFCNEIAKACKKANVEYDDVREGWLMDFRVNPSHTIVYENQPYYDSHCFNKDVPAFANQFDIELLKDVIKINDKNKELNNEKNC